MGMFEITGRESVVQAQEFVVLILENSFSVQNTFALLRHHLADAGMPRRLSWDSRMFTFGPAQRQ
jgi:hypothetical protein